MSKKNSPILDAVHETASGLHDAGVMSAESIRSMAALLGRSPSTVSREVRRNGGYNQYRAAVGEGVEQESEQAVHWWRMAAEQG